MTTMTYQAASGAGSAQMLELVKQMSVAHRAVRKTPSENALEVDRMTITAQRDPSLPTKAFGVPLAGSLLPWIDRGDARRPDPRRMERHGRDQQDPGPESAGAGGRPLRPRRHHALPQPGAVHQAEARMCRSPEIEQMLAAGNQWVRVIPNNKDATSAA